MAAARIGVVVGRFQVPALHAGHRQLLDHVKSNNDYLCVVLGVSRMDAYIAENPLTFLQRQSVIRRDYPNAVILPLFDEKQDEDWSHQLDLTLANTFPEGITTLYGGRKSFAQSYHGVHVGSIEIIEFQETLTLEGTAARAAITEGTDIEFLRGQIYGIHRQFPRVNQAVDIALVKRPDVLLIRRADTGDWAFPGGFADPKADKSLEDAAKRELYEEIGLNGDGTLVYVGSMIVDDWRYRMSRDKIMTALYIAWYQFGRPILNPAEVQDWQWANIEKADDIIAEAHKPLLYALQRKVKS